MHAWKTSSSRRKIPRCIERFGEWPPRALPHGNWPRNATTNYFDVDYFDVGS